MSILDDTFEGAMDGCGGLIALGWAICIATIIGHILFAAPIIAVIVPLLIIAGAVVRRSPAAVPIIFLCMMWLLAPLAGGHAGFAVPSILIGVGLITYYGGKPAWEALAWDFAPHRRRPPVDQAAKDRSVWILLGAFYLLFIVLILALNSL